MNTAIFLPKIKKTTNTKTYEKNNTLTRSYHGDSKTTLQNNLQLLENLQSKDSSIGSLPTQHRNALLFPQDSTLLQ